VRTCQGASAGILNLTAAEAGQYQALCGVISAAAATLQALCMPHTADITTPEVPLQALSQLRTSMQMHARGSRPPRYVALQAWAWSCTVLGSSCVPTNGHLASRADEVCLRSLLGGTFCASVALFCVDRAVISTWSHSRAFP
jgi:hypothetical protein